MPDHLLTERLLLDDPRQLNTRQTIENDVAELIDFLYLIDTLPMQYRSEFYQALGRLVDGFERRHKIFQNVQEMLGQMSLDLKYLIFDLEATRRERDEYRRRCEENPV